MNRLMINVLNVAIAAALAAGLSACNRNAAADTSSDASAMSNGTAPVAAPSQAPAPADNGPQYAQVVGVEPVRQSVSDPQRVCHDQVVTHTAPPRDQNHIAGTAIGAVAGGLLGHMVGGHHSKTLTTVAGAGLGGYAGNRIEAAHQQGEVTQTVERRCDTVDNASSKVVAFDVHYVFNGVTRTVRMDHDPGDRVQVQQGITAVSDAR